MRARPQIFSASESGGWRLVILEKDGRPRCKEIGMYLDAFEDNRSCLVGSRDHEHGSEECDSQGLNCKICIDGWWVDKVRNSRNLCNC